MTETDLPLARVAEAAQAHLQLTLSEAQLARFAALYRLVLDTNATMNLTRITAPDAFATQHLLDSLTLAPWLNNLNADASVADIGSGAGFPTLPLAIVYSHLTFTAVESLQKKARFIAQAAETLGLANVRVLADRAETLGQAKATRERFSVVTARAVAALPVLAELCLPLVRPGGVFLAMKTAGTAETECQTAAAAYRLLGGDPPDIHPVADIPDLGGHVVIASKKARPTPKIYPRTAGFPAKKPLLQG